MPANQIPPLPQNLGGAGAAPLLTALNDRLRRINTALSATAPATSAAVEVMYGTHAERVGRPVPADRIIYVETDRGNVAYQVRGTAFVWLSGTMAAAWSSMPADLGKADAGFLFFGTDSLHIWQWSGSAWGWGPGNRASGEMAEFDSDPGTGWHLCDGSGGLTKYAANGTRVTSFTVPDRRGFYTEGAAGYTGTGVPAATPPATATGGAVGLTTTTGSVAAGGGAASTFLTGVTASVTNPVIAFNVPPVPTFATLYYYRL